jgi:hypothetical protein
MFTIARLSNCIMRRNPMLLSGDIGLAGGLPMVAAFDYARPDRYRE